MYRSHKAFGLLHAVNWLSIFCLIILMFSCCSKTEKIESNQKLAVAVSNNDIATVNKLIGKADNINLKNEEGNTLLAIASSSGFESVVEILLKNKADFNAANKDGITPLMLAAKNGKIKVISLLVNKGADINLLDNVGRTALMIAIENDQDEIAISLINHGASLATHNKLDGSTPLLESVRKNKTPLVKLLIEKRADVFAVNDIGCDMLMLASENNNLELIQIALDKGLIANRMTMEGNTAVYYAQNNNGIVKLIINKTLAKDGWTEYFAENSSIYFMESKYKVQAGNIKKVKIRNYDVESNEYNEVALELDCQNRSFCYESYKGLNLGVTPTNNDPIIIYEKNNCGELNDKMELVSLALRVCKPISN